MTTPDCARSRFPLPKGGRGAFVLLLCLAGAGCAAAPAAPAPDLPGTSWRVSAYDGGRGELVLVQAGTSLSLAFSRQSATGSAGCNRFTAGYRADGAKLTFGPAAATKKMCVTPEGVMGQEDRFLGALGSVAGARLAGDRLELLAADGRALVRLERADAR